MAQNKICSLLSSIIYQTLMVTTLINKPVYERHFNLNRYLPRRHYNCHLCHSIKRVSRQTESHNELHCKTVVV